VLALGCIGIVVGILCSARALAINEGVSVGRLIVGIGRTTNALAVRAVAMNVIGIKVTARALAICTVAMGVSRLIVAASGITATAVTASYQQAKHHNESQKQANNLGFHVFLLLIIISVVNRHDSVFI
jgi:hypothetical protein